MKPTQKDRRSKIPFFLDEIISIYEDRVMRKEAVKDLDAHHAQTVLRATAPLELAIHSADPSLLRIRNIHRTG